MGQDVLHRPFADGDVLAHLLLAQATEGLVQLRARRTDALEKLLLAHMTRLSLARQSALNECTHLRIEYRGERAERQLRYALFDTLPAQTGATLESASWGNGRALTQPQEPGCAPSV